MIAIFRWIDKFGWYIKRVKVMEPIEIVWRILERMQIFYLWCQWQLKYHRRHKFKTFKIEDCKFLASQKTVLPKLAWSFELDLKAQLKLIDGYSFAMGYSWQWNNNDKVWHIAPDSGKKWPLRFFANISYRNGNPYGDARVVWEPSRLQQLISLALLVDYSNDPEIKDRAIDLLENELLSWYTANPPLTGIHYVSSMECALRLIAVVYAYDIARTSLKRKAIIAKVISEIVFSHAKLISKRLSLYSSAGNHTIAECAGLIYAGILFTEFRQAKSWKDLGISIFEKEIGRQIMDDGGGLEQAIWYLLFVTDLAGLVSGLLNGTNGKCSLKIENAFRRGRLFLGKFANSPDSLPSIGDSDSGFALSKYLRISFDCGLNNCNVYTFNSAGYSLIGSQSNKKEVNLIFDHGSLGMAPSYGHGHADALSVQLAINGKRFLIDPGTYTYTGDQKWRSYFRGTRAHNTVIIDALDQSTQESTFLWSDPYTAKLVRSEYAETRKIRMLAYHDGYNKLGVRHWRAVIYQKDDFIIIWDYIQGTGIHNLELNWHLGGNPEKQDDVYFIRNDSIMLEVKLDGGEVHVRRGEMNPILGWCSQLYGSKEPITVIQSQYTGTLPFQFVTKIKFGINKYDDTFFEKEVELMKEWWFENKES